MHVKQIKRESICSPLIALNSQPLACFLKHDLHFITESISDTTKRSHTVPSINGTSESRDRRLRHVQDTGQFSPIDTRLLYQVIDQQTHFVRFGWTDKELIEHLNVFIPEDTRN